MKSGFCPSYLFLSRHGIYYFRCRIPFDVRSQYNPEQTEVRVSLRTSNRPDELKKARRLWVDLFDNHNISNGATSMIAIGLPSNKYDRLMHIPEALKRIREYYGERGTPMLCIVWHNSSAEKRNIMNQ